MDDKKLAQRRQLESSIVNAYPEVEKDIFMVIKDGYKFVKPCIESVINNTTNFHLYIWDNASGDETANYLKSLKNIKLFRSDINEGFIAPNNQLAAIAESPYFILLNSDTLVRKGWDRAMTSMLQLLPRLGVVGYCGGVVNEQCVGVNQSYGHDIDFVQGHCLAMRRSTYLEHGLFDEKNLKFAYGEDSDLSFRLREAGLGCYALALDYVWHKGGGTSLTIIDEVRKYFNSNHCYLQVRWKEYLEKDRIMVKKASK